MLLIFIFFHRTLVYPFKDLPSNKYVLHNKRRLLVDDLFFFDLSNIIFYLQASYFFEILEFHLVVDEKTLDLFQLLLHDFILVLIIIIFAVQA